MIAAYIAYGIQAKHLLAAVIMTAPGTILLAKILVPETEKPLTAGRVEIADMERDTNILGAISRGTVDGLHLARINVGAMLISFIALYLSAWMEFSAACTTCWQSHGVRLVPFECRANLGLAFVSRGSGSSASPGNDCPTIANLLGLRLVTNELVAFQRLGPMQNTLDPRTYTIATFALCGFANFSSIGIQIGGAHRSTLAPNKRAELAQLGLRALMAGTMANLMSASIVGIMLR